MRPFRSQPKLHTIQKDAGMGRIDRLSRPTAGEDEELTLGDMVPSGEDMEGDAIKALDTAAMRREVWLAVDALPDRLSAVVRMRYRNGKTLGQTGTGNGVGRKIPLYISHNVWKRREGSQRQEIPCAGDGYDERSVNGKDSSRGGYG